MFSGVAARATASFYFKGKNIDVREIGDKLYVAHVLEGSVRKAGNRLRITAQLISSKLPMAIISGRSALIGN